MRARIDMSIIFADRGEGLVQRKSADDLDRLACGPIIAGLGDEALRELAYSVKARACDSISMVNGRR